MYVRTARALGAAVALAAGLSLAGCATGSQASSETPASTASPSTSATPTATATEGQPVTNGSNSLLTPGDGATVVGPTVTVTGDATAYEGNLAYEVVDSSGATVDRGFTNGGANGEVGPYEFELTLDPGTYTVRVWEPGQGENDSSAPPRNEVSATFTVR
ncbi:Gmad2 immunoglobulin-like domain-containing protein [Isoptericola sp. b441]|uniref:Gmad2 immunoglobulin-like domain-containing protein n=1 Tax=Actinotalea lenta TaxID=3064654 RepID=A0ABT9DBY8_9CELL|nr:MULTISPECIES: Gmad2 immunoglobulin-like domain-containing protein [unclassified Isoptericola]MDO8108115.1 Gmad2 immunoglobulin-like domain-containing protein [Isoptericola sp. b441]MDO8120215.1 Gmad2 immunoglobulin-like domain-containing protein [Isoptericola sp. b490]